MQLKIIKDKKRPALSKEEQDKRKEALYQYLNREKENDETYSSNR